MDLTSEKIGGEKDDPIETQSNLTKPALNAFSILMGARKVFSPTKVNINVVDSKSQSSSSLSNSNNNSNKRWNRHESRTAPKYKLIRFGKMTTPIVVDGFQYASKELSDTYIFTHHNRARQ